MMRSLNYGLGLYAGDNKKLFFQMLLLHEYTCIGFLEAINDN